MKPRNEVIRKLQTLLHHPCQWAGQAWHGKFTSPVDSLFEGDQLEAAVYEILVENIIEWI